MTDPMVRKANVETLMASVRHIYGGKPEPFALRCLAHDLTGDYPQERITVYRYPGEPVECLEPRLHEAIRQLKEKRHIRVPIHVYYDYEQNDPDECERGDERWNRFFALQFDAEHGRSAVKRASAKRKLDEMGKPAGLPWW